MDKKEMTVLTHSSTPKSLKMTTSVHRSEKLLTGIRNLTEVLRMYTWRKLGKNLTKEA